MGISLNAETRAKVRYIISLFLYGTIGLLLHYISGSSEFVVLCRSAIGVTFILVLYIVTGQRPDFAVIKANGRNLLFSGLCLGLNWITLFAAYRVMTVAVASLCNHMAPIFILILTPLVLKEKLSLRKSVCVLAAFLGIAMVSGVIDSAGNFNVKGIVLGLTAAFGFVGVVFCNKDLSEVPILDKTVVQIFTAMLLVLPYVIMRRGDIVLPTDIRSIALIVVLGVFNTGIADILYFDSIANIPVQSIAILGYLDPVIAVLTSTVILHEKMSLCGVIGTILVLGAALYSEMPNSTPGVH